MSIQKLFLLLLALFLLAGCFGGKVPETRYYVLDYVPLPHPERQKKGPLPISLRIAEFDVAEVYRRPELVYRQSAHELRFYNFHKWAVKPSHIIGDMVEKHIKQSGYFKDVSRSGVNFNPDYTLSGVVLAIEEFDSRNKWYAHLALSFSLEDHKKNQIVWQKNYDLRKGVPQQEPIYVIRELSYLLEFTVNQVLQDLEKIMEDKNTLNTLEERK